MLDEIKEFYRREIQPKLGNPVGATPDEIDKLEKAIGCELPDAYREFLLWMGKDHRGIFQGSDCFIEHVPDNKEVLENLLRDNKVEYEVPSNCIVFFTHQGYIAAWFFAGKAEPDPEIWVYSESIEMEKPQTYGTFSGWLSAEISGLAADIP